MQYRTFGKLEWHPSALGFGCMRLPTLDGDPGRIDEPEAIRMLRFAIDHGVNYVDTAYPYHRGTSEPFVGRALRDGYRQRVRLATKLPSWLVQTAGDFDRYLDEQLERLQTESIDFYLLHGLGRERWQNLRDLGVLAWAERAMAEGRFHHLGFSFHDSFEVFREIVDAYDGWTFCQIQYNYMDDDYQAGVKGLRYAAERGLGIVVMEPLRGGMLAQNVPPAVQALWDTATRGHGDAETRGEDEGLRVTASSPLRVVPRTPAEWALHWVWNQPEVSLALSGMTTMQQVEENIASAGRSGPGTLAPDELALIDRVKQAYQELCPIPCTDCRYCQPCPNGVAISRIFALYNEATMYNAVERSRMVYEQWLREDERADCCLACGECEAACPQGIEIIEWLKKADQLLASIRES
jgi:predicted aldo/keto reductase-like oxidoreductase